MTIKFSSHSNISVSCVGKVSHDIPCGKHWQSTLTRVYIGLVRGGQGRSGGSRWSGLQGQSGLNMRFFSNFLSITVHN